MLRTTLNFPDLHS